MPAGPRPELASKEPKSLFRFNSVAATFTAPLWESGSDRHLHVGLEAKPIVQLVVDEDVEEVLRHTRIGEFLAG